MGADGCHLVRSKDLIPGGSESTRKLVGGEKQAKSDRYVAATTCALSGKPLKHHCFMNEETGRLQNEDGDSCFKAILTEGLTGFVCPVTTSPLDGQSEFVALRPCGHVISQAGMDETVEIMGDDDVECPVCYDAVESIIEVSYS